MYSSRTRSAELRNDHFREYAKEHKLGVDVLFDKNLEGTIVQKIASEGQLNVSRHDEEWHYETRHPDIGVIDQVETSRIAT